MGRPRKDIKGKRFNRLEVIRVLDIDLAGAVIWECQCDCGNTTTGNTSNLVSGKKKSCGCLHKEASKTRATKHGLRYVPEYRVWLGVKDRCLNPNHDSYKDYGGRGITICDRWKDSFENFYEDMGERPKGLTLERVDNSLGYNPENCKWASYTEQSLNRRPRKNKLGVPGIHESKYSYICRWSENGDVKTKSFSKREYGKEALTLAIDYREDKIKTIKEGFKNE